MATRSEKRITVAEYERLIEDGLLTEDDRVELLEGEIVEMSPSGFPHVTCVANLNRFFTRQAPDDILVLPGAPVILSDDSEPEPDLTLIGQRPPDSQGRHPRAPEVLLTIEVSDSSLSRDLHRKRRLYALAGIPEYWVVNVNDECVLRFRKPLGPEYSVEEIFHRGQSLAPAALSTLFISVDSIFESR